jgi:predicted DNA-binding transcriptional regulator AlpA
MIVPSPTKEINMTPEQPDALLSMSAVMKIISVTSRTTVYRYLHENPDFPKPCKIGASRGRVKFKAREIAQFIDSLKAGE